MTLSQYSDLLHITLHRNLQSTYFRSRFYSGNIRCIAPQLSTESALFCCKAFLENIKAHLNVELGSHTFSHYYCLEEGQTTEDFEADIEQARKYALDNYKTIIFPRNQISEEYLKICAEHGFTHYRGILEDFIHRPSKSESHLSVKGALRLLDAYLPITGHKTFKDIEEVGGMKNVPGSMFLRPYNRKLKALEKLKIARIKKSMLHAAKTGEYFHLWWHPHNYGDNMKENLKQLEEICRHFHHLQTKYGMKSLFISEL